MGTFNPREPLKSLFTRLNKCVDYATAAGDPVTEVQIVRITYGLVTETGQFQEDCQTWCVKLEQENTLTLF